MLLLCALPLLLPVGCFCSGLLKEESADWGFVVASGGLLCVCVCVCGRVWCCFVAGSTWEIVSIEVFIDGSDLMGFCVRSENAFSVARLMARIGEASWLCGIGWGLIYCKLEPCELSLIRDV